MDYLNILPPEIFFQICSNLSISSLVKLSIVYPQLIDNKFWHALYARRFRKEIYRDNINWKRQYTGEFFKCYVNVIYSQCEYEHLYFKSCYDDSGNYHPIVWKIKALIIADLDDNDEKFSRSTFFIKDIDNMKYKLKWVITAWFEAEEEMAPFFSKELFFQIQYYMMTRIHRDWKVIIGKMMKSHGDVWVGGYIYDAGQMAQLSLFRFAERMADKRFSFVVDNMIGLLLRNQIPNELAHLTYIHRKCFRRFIEYHNFGLDKYEVGVALLLLNFIFCDDLCTPPPQKLYKYISNTFKKK